MRACTSSPKPVPLKSGKGDSQVYWFEGGFSDYEENRKKRTGGDIVPHRIKYRKLVRG